MHKQLNWNVFETNESETTISQFLFNYRHLVWAWKRYIGIWYDLDTQLNHHVIKRVEFFLLTVIHTNLIHIHSRCTK